MAAEADGVCSRKELQNLEAAHRVQIETLQHAYEDRLKNVVSKLHATQELITSDESLSALLRSGSSAAQIHARVEAVVQRALVSEQEVTISRLARQVSRCEAEIARMQREASTASVALEKSKKLSREVVEASARSSAFAALVEEESALRQQSELKLMAEVERCHALEAELQSAHAGATS